MKKFLRELERVLQIPGKSERLAELQCLLQRMGSGLPESSGKDDGGYEERLVLAVYDRICVLRRKWDEGFRLVILLIAVLVLIAVIRALVPPSLIESFQNFQTDNAGVMPQRN